MEGGIYGGTNVKVGVVKELKIGEHRVGLIPVFVSSLVAQSHEILVEKNAGLESGFTDAEYRKAGAKIVDNADEIWQDSDLIVKVKEPIQTEYPLIQPGQILFTYLHLAPNIELTDALMKSGASCIAYETVTDDHGGLPLLAPMSAIAGRMSIFVAANLLQKRCGGSGVLPCGVAGVPSSKILILGGGNVGINATFIAHGIGADVTVFDNRAAVLSHISERFAGQVKTVYSTRYNIVEHIRDADIVVGAALVVGASTPKLISRAMLKDMKTGSVIVDVAIDQGGCFETSHPTTHDNPYYDVSGITHYCVTNMPGTYSRTATISLNNATYPFIEKLANMGCLKALSTDINLRNGLNIYDGSIINQAVANSQGRTAVKFDEL